jgi:hypothetical protein
MLLFSYRKLDGEGAMDMRGRGSVDAEAALADAGKGVRSDDLVRSGGGSKGLFGVGPREMKYR